MPTKLFLGLLSLAWLLPAPAHAQNRRRRPAPSDAVAVQRSRPAPPAPLPPPVIMVERNGRSTPLELRAVDARVTIVGHLAETSLTMTFYNPNDRQLAGDLYFPLPHGATVSAYALDVNGQLVDGVVVPKDKARQAFETEVRKGIDPGLVEWTKGNSFKTRVFPIPARGARTVRVGYVSEVATDARGASYRLPLAFRDPVGAFSLRLDVVHAAAAPVVVRGGPRGLAFQAADHRYVARTRLTNARLTEDLVISLPRLDDRPVHVERADDGRVYFAIRHAVAAPPVAAPRAVPRRIALYWDASLSRKDAPHDAELAALAGYLDTLRGGAVKVDLVFVRDHAEAPRRFSLPDQRAQLMSALREVAYDGGTQLGALGGVRGADLNLVFTDGLSTFGAEKPARLTGATYVVSAAPVANRAFLRYLAVTTGGAYHDLTRSTPAAVAAAIGTQAFSFLRAEVRGASGTAVDDLYPRLREPVAGAFHAAGVLTGAQAEVTLLYGVGDHVTARRRFLVRASDAVPGDLLRRYWAQKSIDDLLVFPDENERAITAIGMKHGVVTPGTSLIVLERLDQYLQHEIRPPASLPAMRSQYDRELAQRVQIARDAQAEKLERVLAMWRARVSWWSQRYRYPRNFKFRNGNAEGDGAGGVGHGRGAVRARRPASVTAARDDAPAGDAAAPPAEGEMADESKAKDKKTTGGDDQPAPEITIKAWNPDTPYLRALERAPAARRFRVYLAERAKFGTSPAFYLDVAEFFRTGGDAGLARQILSNLAELELENPALLRVLAHRLAQLGDLDLSVQTFEQVLAMRPEEPQSFRDLALVLARRADRRGAAPAERKADYVRAMELLAKVVMGEWQRFDEIEVIALTELNNALAKARRLGVRDGDVAIDARLVKNLEMDVRIVMTWDADQTDMDLHVVEPSGEEAYYGHNRTTIGGLVSRDFTQGYGPEVYAVRRAMRGKYAVKTKFFGSSAASLIGAVTLQVDIFTNYGRPNERRQSLTLRLTKEKEDFEVGNITF